MQRIHTVILAFALSLPALSSEAQTGPRPQSANSGEASLVIVSVSGGRFVSTGVGLGLDFALAHRFSDTFAIALGVQGSRHHESDLDANLTGYQVYAEPRYLIQTTHQKIKPYAFGRVGFVSASGSATGVYGYLCPPPASGDRTCSASRSGWSAGVGAGLVFQQSGALRYHASASFHSVHFGNMKGEGTELPESSFSGTAILLRAGVSISLGH